MSLFHLNCMGHSVLSFHFLFSLKQLQLIKEISLLFTVDLIKPRTDSCFNCCVFLFFKKLVVDR